MQQQHFIHKVTFNLDFENEDHVKVIQNRYKDSFQQKVLPELEKLFDDISGTNEVVRIDKIDIDLGDNAIQTSKEALSRQIKVQIEKAVFAQIYSNPQQGKVEKVSLAEAKMDTLIYFLKKGYLPSVGVSIDLRNDMQQLIEEKSSKWANTLKKI